MEEDKPYEEQKRQLNNKTDVEETKSSANETMSEDEEAEKLRRIQMRENIERMRQNKSENMQYQEQLAGQRMPEQVQNHHQLQEKSSDSACSNTVTSKLAPLIKLKYEYSEGMFTVRICFL